VWSVGTLTGLSAPALAFFATRHTTGELALGIWIGVACALPVLFVLVKGSVDRVSNDRNIRRREPGDARPTDAAAPLHVGPRAVLARVARAAVSDASAAQTTVAVVIAFTATATALPAALRLPRWIELEWVLLAWWAIAATALAVLLYRGSRLVDDHELVFAWPWWGATASQRTPLRPCCEITRPFLLSKAPWISPTPRTETSPSTCYPACRCMSQPWR
jgi:hypothetical protein